MQNMGEGEVFPTSATGAELGITQTANCCKRHGPSQPEEQSDGIARLQAETTEERATSVTGSSAFSIQQTDCRGRKRGKSGSRGPSPLMKHTGTPHGGGRTLAILRLPTTAREGVLTLVCEMELLVWKWKKTR